MKRQITPLSKFPTEVLVHYFKKLRKCFTYTERDKQIGVERHWSDVLNDFYELPVWSTKKINTTSGYFLDNTLWFKFEGMYWNGSIDELKNELDKRPHVDIKNSKDFRKWKIKWKKNK